MSEDSAIDTAQVFIWSVPHGLLDEHISRSLPSTVKTPVLYLILWILKLLQDQSH